MLCTAALESQDTEVATQAKMQLIARASELMPQGKPQFLAMRSYPAIAQLIAEHGPSTIHKAVLQLVKNFCASVNVVRNMSEDQMIEAAGMLIDECGTFRLEDYVMMFTLAKRGDLVKILDRVDIQVIGQMLDEYWERRNAAGNREMEKSPVHEVPKDAKLVDPAKVSAALKDFVEEVKAKAAEAHVATDEEMEIRRQEILRRQRALWTGKPLELESDSETDQTTAA